MEASVPLYMQLLWGKSPLALSNEGLLAPALLWCKMHATPRCWLVLAKRSGRLWCYVLHCYARSVSCVPEWLFLCVYAFSRLTPDCTPTWHSPLAAKQQQSVNREVRPLWILAGERKSGRHSSPSIISHHLKSLQTKKSVANIRNIDKALINSQTK